jgi:hypothetical protein
MPRRGKPWTTEADDALRTAVEAGYSLSVMSTALGRSEPSIKSRAYIVRLSLDPKHASTRSAQSERLQERRLLTSPKVTGLKAKK